MEDRRGKHGKQGRKPTGRRRNQKLYCEFTPEEKAEIIDYIKTSGKTQSDFILEAVRFYNCECLMEDSNHAFYALTIG